MSPASQVNIAEKKGKKKGKPLAVWIRAFRRAHDPKQVISSSDCISWHNRDCLSLQPCLSVAERRCNVLRA